MDRLKTLKRCKIVNIDLPLGGIINLMKRIQAIPYYMRSVYPMIKRMLSLYFQRFAIQNAYSTLLIG